MKADESNIESWLSLLPGRERTYLAPQLRESLTPGQHNDVDQLWLEEAKRRLERFDESPSAARVFDSAL